MKQISLFTAIAIATALTACGGGGGSSASTNTGAASSASATAVAQGMVTGFGSVIVNGVHFDVKSANIDEDGSSKVESELGVGQMVRITGTIDPDGIHGKAIKLSAESQLRGPITSIDLVNGVIVALGQTVLITTDTFYEDGLTAASLKVGDVIKVSSYTDTNGNLVATRIELETGDAAKDLQLTGAITDLNTTAMTFSLNGTTVDYSKATISDLPNKTISNDLMVRVHGTMVNGVFVATGNVHLSQLDLKHDGELDTKINFGVVGQVSNLIAGTSFTLGNTTVTFNSSTVFDGGAAADLSNGLSVKVKGKFDANHNLVASKIKLILNAEVDDEGLVDAIDLTANTFGLNGITFEVTVDTSFIDRSKAKVRLFGLKDLATGDYIEVRGYKVAATATTPEHIVTTRVERKNPSEKGKEGFKTEISGKVESATSDSIMVSGHSVKLTNTTAISGFNNLQAFLAAAVGLKVEIKGVVLNDVFIARVVKVENEQDGEHGDSHHSSSKSSSSASLSSSSVASSSASSEDSSEVSSSSESSSAESSESSSAASSTSSEASSSASSSEVSSSSSSSSSV